MTSTLTETSPHALLASSLLGPAHPWAQGTSIQAYGLYGDRDDDRDRTVDIPISLLGSRRDGPSRRPLAVEMDLEVEALF